MTWMQEVHDDEAERPPAAVHEAEGHEAEPGGEADEDRAEQQAELRHAERELALRGEEALEREPPAHDVRHRGPSGRRSAARRTRRGSATRPAR